MLPLLLLLPLASALPQALPAPTCLDRSLALKTVTITNAYINRGSPFQQETTTVSFSVTTPALGISAKCNATSIALTPNGVGSDPYVWYPCDVEENEVEATVRFQYDATLNFLTVEGRWVCEGDAWQPRIPIYAEGWNEFEVGTMCVERDGFSRTCVQEEGGKVEFEVGVVPALRRGGN